MILTSRSFSEQIICFFNVIMKKGNATHGSDGAHSLERTFQCDE